METSINATDTGRDGIRIPKNPQKENTHDLRRDGKSLEGRASGVGLTAAKGLVGTPGEPHHRLKGRFGSNSLSEHSERKVVVAPDGIGERLATAKNQKGGKPHIMFSLRMETQGFLALIVGTRQEVERHRGGIQ